MTGGPEPTLVRPRWLAPTSFALALLGLAVSVYLSYEHLTENKSLVCPTGGAASSCLTVTTSPWSQVAGIPVAYLGLAFFVVVAVLCAPQVWRHPAPALDAVRAAALGLGLVSVLYLVWIELFRVHAICTWCTVVHIVTFLLAVVVVFGQILSVRRAPGST